MNAINSIPNNITSLSVKFTKYDDYVQIIKGVPRKCSELTITAYSHDYYDSFILAGQNSILRLLLKKLGDLSRFTNLRKIKLKRFTKNYVKYFMNSPNTLKEINLDEINQFVDPSFTKFASLIITGSVRINAFAQLFIEDGLEHLTILRTLELIGEGCDDFDIFIKIFNSHRSWDSLNSNVQFVNLENRSKKDCETFQKNISRIDDEYVPNERLFDKQRLEMVD